MATRRSGIFLPENGNFQQCSDQPFGIHEKLQGVRMSPKSNQIKKWEKVDPG